MLKMGFEEERGGEGGKGCWGQWEQTTHLPLLSEGVCTSWARGSRFKSEWDSSGSTKVSWRSLPAQGRSGLDDKSLVFSTIGFFSSVP